MRAKSTVFLGLKYYLHLILIQDLFTQVLCAAP